MPYSRDADPHRLHAHVGIGRGASRGVAFFLAHSTGAVQKSGDLALRVQLDGSVGATVAAVDLAPREKACCSFFEFSIEVEADACWLSIKVPPDAAGTLEEFASAAADSAGLRRRRETFVGAQGPYTETWGPDRFGDPCRECAFEWSLTTEQAIASVMATPDSYARASGRPMARSATRTSTGPWARTSATSPITCHLGPVARRGGAAGEASVPGYEERLLGDARFYERVPVGGALWQLRQATHPWHEAVSVALAHDVVLAHESRGPQSVNDVVRSNAARRLSPRMGHPPDTPYTDTMSLSSGAGVLGHPGDDGRGGLGRRARIKRWLRVVLDHELCCFCRSAVDQELHQTQGHVDATRYAGRGDDPLIEVLDHSLRGRDRAVRGQLGVTRPMRGGSQAVKESSCSENERAGADRRGEARCRMGMTDPFDDLAVVLQRSGAHASRKHDHVGLGELVKGRVGCHAEHPVLAAVLAPSSFRRRRRR